jgi:hypothetical protein
VFKYFFRSTFYLQKFNYTVDKGSNKGLHKVAALIRGASIRSLRISKRTSPPGNPPFAKTSGGLRVIEYVVDKRVAVIGPVKFPTSNFFNQPVPHIHEFGGTFFSQKAYYNYPERSYMNHTLKQLVAKGAIPKQFKVGMATQFNITI